MQQTKCEIHVRYILSERRCEGGDGCVQEACLSERHKHECFCETGRPPLHSATVLPLNFSSLKDQFVHNLAVNDLSFCASSVFVDRSVHLGIVCVCV